MDDDETRWRHKFRDPALAIAAVKELVVNELYVLVAIGATPPAWLTCCHTDGQEVVPCYLSERTARSAAANLAQVVRVPGRDLFGSLPKISAWIDPLGVGLLLTPELMKVVLTSVPPPKPVGKDHTLSSWTETSDLPPQVRIAWTVVLGKFPGVMAAYWLGTHSYSRHRKVVVLTRDDKDTPRMLDAMVVSLRASYSGQMRIEAQALAEGQTPEAQSRLEMFSPFYSTQVATSAQERREINAGFAAQPGDPKVH